MPPGPRRGAAGRSGTSGTELRLALGVLVHSGGATLWHIYVFVLALGTVNAVETPTRMSFLSEMVGVEPLPNASALSAAYFNAARILGPAVAGLLISGYGVATVMLLNAVSHLATVVCLLLMRPDELVPGADRRRDAKVMDGLRHVAARRDLLLPLSLVASIGLLGFNFQLVLPLLAKTVFHTGCASFGLLTTALAAGSLAAAVTATTRNGGPSERLVLRAALGFALTETVAGPASGRGPAS
ncbi:MFS transporter [Streptomyces sp. NPDC001315]|uniref:MFS transporter n=1 Tax=Streptomyces sp. NPDC001315 TaxID=3364562 RepID=UPI0036825A4D